LRQPTPRAARRAALGDYRVRITEYGVREGIGGLEYRWLGERGGEGAKVQRCKSASGRYKRREGRGVADAEKITEFRVQITDLKGMR